MASAYITTRTRANGAKRHVVRYRLGGRETLAQHAGSFKAMKDARARRVLVAGELAAGRDPAILLRELATPTPVRTATSLFETWKATRLDLDQRTLANCEMHWKRLAPIFADLPVDEITHEHVQRWVTENATGERPLSPKVLRDYMGTLKQMLDYDGADPNPARDRRVRYPTAEQPITIPPSDRQVLALLEQMPLARRLFYVFLEQDGGRLGEHIAFTWGDVDVATSRILARPEVVKGRGGRRKPRWVQIPEWLMERLLATCPPEDRTAERPLFGWLGGVAHPRQAANRTMRDACKAAGIPHFHPHDLRHRRISLWHGQGIPARVIGDRVGQRQVAVTLDTYTHVMTLDEVTPDRYLELLDRTI